MSEAADPGTASPTAYDHLRPTADDSGALDRQPGVYRVVGAPDDEVTLLRVTDGEGRRVHTGEVVTVERESLDRFEPAANPDEQRSLAATAASQLQGAWWSLRLVGEAVVDRPIPSAAALALVAAGLFGDAVASVPADALFVLAGALALVYLSRTNR